MASHSLAFVRLTPDLWILGSDLEIVPPSTTTNVFFIGDFFSKADWLWLRPRVLRTANTAELIAELETQNRTPFVTSWTPPSRSDFAARFTDLKKHFAAGILQKAVPVVFETSPHTPDHSMRRNLLRNLCDAPQGLTPYGYWFEDHGLVGATPELLLRQESASTFATVAVAGTRARDQQPSLLERPKDLLEHQLVIQDIQAALADLAQVEKGPTREVPSGASLIHLRTDLSVQSSSNFLALVQALHPTAALGALPRGPGLEWLRSPPDSSARGPFGAPFGFLDQNGLGTAWVAIRNIQWQQQNGSRIGAGCGVVPESQLDAEWNELQIKRQSVKTVLGL